MNTIENFILNRPEIGFHFKPKGHYNRLICSSLRDGQISPYQQFTFNKEGYIETETGIQGGWTANPPGSTPPEPTKYLRKYSYSNSRLSKIEEIERITGELLKSYLFSYESNNLALITEYNKGHENYHSKTTQFYYNTDGYLIRKKVSLLSPFETKNYIKTDLHRNKENRITITTKVETSEIKGEVISKNAISSCVISYDKNTITKKCIYTNHKKPYIISAELLHHQGILIKEINYHNKTFEGKRITYEYDEKSSNLRQEITTENGKAHVMHYKYE